MSGLRIQEAVTPADLAAFIRFPYRLHRREAHWVPPLLLERRDFHDPQKNPVYEYARIRLFLALDGRDVVGTIAAIRRNSPLDVTLAVLAFAGLSSPAFLNALLGLFVFSVWLHWAPSGGMSTLDDLRRLAVHPGIEGAIIGRALYTGDIDLPPAVREFTAQA